MKLAPPPTIINEEEKYKVEESQEVLEMRKRGAVLGTLKGLWGRT